MQLFLTFAAPKYYSLNLKTQNIMKRKLFTTCLMFLVTFIAQAQTKIVPQLEKGMKVTYTGNTVSTVGENKIEVASEVDYVVSQKTADGYVIDMTMTKMESANGADLMSRLMNLTEEMMKGVTIKVATDNEGKPKGVNNLEDVKQACLKGATKMIDELYAENPAVAQAMPKEVLLEQAEKGITEEALLNSMLTTPTSVFVLNGKSVANMTQDTYTNSQGIKMKRMYFVAKDGKTVTTNSQSEMTKDELKQLIIKQVEENMPEQAEMIKQNIDAVLASGMMKVESKEKAVYTLQDNGWLKSVDMTQDLNMMGQQVSVKATMNLK